MFDKRKIKIIKIKLLGRMARILRDTRRLIRKGEIKLFKLIVRIRRRR